MDFFREQSWCRHPDQAEFFALVDIAASLHHAQNDLLYSHYFKNLFTPYLDIDYLETLFQSEYHFLIKKRYPSRFQQRLQNHRFSTDLQYILNKRFISIPYNSGFKVSEYRLNPLYAALRARLRKKYWHFPTNFPLGNWMYEFILDELSNLSHSDSVVNEAFEINDLHECLARKDREINNEARWLKYTTPVQMNLILGAFY